MLSCNPIRTRLGICGRTPSRLLSSAHASRLRTNQSQANLRSIAHEGIHLTTRRSLSENVNTPRVAIQCHQQSCSRLYSTSSSSSSQSGAEEKTLLEQLEEEENEWCSLVENPEAIDSDMLVLKPDLKNLPPLPRIQNEAISQQVFTHRSVYSRARHEFEDQPNDPAPDYEVLEFQGDAVLGLVITDLVRNYYPNLRVGPLTKMKSMVVANVNLADISVKYGLPRSLRVNRASAITLKASIHTQADLFEAYIGGLYKDQGLEVTRSWLNILFLPYVKEAYRVLRDQHGLPSPPPSPYLPHAPDVPPDPTTPTSDQTTPTPPPGPQAGNAGHLSLFHQYLQQRQMIVEWKFEAIKDEGTKVTPIWAAYAVIGGVQLSVGRGNTKKTAQNEAAREALIQLGVTNPFE